MSLHLAAATFAQAAQGPTSNDFIRQVPILIGMVALFWLIIIRPQQKKAKEQAELLKNLKANDKVITSSGLIGTVISVKDNAVSLRCGEAKLEVTKASVADVTERASS